MANMVFLLTYVSTFQAYKSLLHSRLDLVMLLEEAFQVELDDEDSFNDSFVTINSLAAFVHGRIA